MRLAGRGIVALLLMSCCSRPAKPPKTVDAGVDGGSPVYGDRCENYEPPIFSQATKRICDGSEALRLGVLVPARPDRLEPGSHVIYDNGGSFLYVDGKCRYWVLGRNMLGSPTRTGVLDEAAESALASRLLYDIWPQLVGEWIPIYDEVTDVAPYVFTSGPGRDSAIICHDLCSANVPRELDVLRCEFWSALESIYASGSDASGAMRYQLVARPNTTPDVLYPWPLSQAPNELAVDPNDTGLTFGMGHLASGDDADRLRQLRIEYRQTGLGQRVLEIPVADAEGRVFGLFLRDAVGLEGANGIVLSW